MTVDTRLKPYCDLALKSLEDFDALLTRFIDSKPTTLQSYLFFCAIENLMKTAQESIYSEMMKSFPGSSEEKDTMQTKLKSLAEELVKEFNEKARKPKSTLWTPKTQLMASS